MAEERWRVVRREQEAAAAERKRREARKRATIARGGQVLETYKGPDTLGGAVYELLGKGAGGLSRLLGADEQAAARTKRQVTDNVRTLGELVIGPEDLERTARRIAGGDADWLDYGVAGLTVLPATRLGRKVLSTAGRKTARAATAPVRAVAKPVRKAVESTDWGRKRAARIADDDSWMKAELAADKRPQYERVDDGAGHLTVRRKGLVPATVPEAQSARTLGDLRVLTRDYSSNPARQLVDQSAREARGAPYDPDLLPRTSLERQAGIGRAYTEAVSGNPDYDRAIFERYGEVMPEVVEKSGAQNYDQLREAAYLALSDEVRSQFDRLPIQSTYHSGDLEYAVPSAMMRDALGKGNLNVFKGGDPHEFLDRLDPVTGLTDNEMFRAVHDYAGHVAPGSTFRPDGEEIAYATHAQTMSPLAQMALLSETRGQNSLVNYSGLNADIIEPMEIAKRQLKERALAEKYLARGGTDEDRVREALSTLPPAEDLKAQLRELGGRWRYADQKAVLLPPEYLDPMSPGGMPEYLRKVLQTPDAVSARGVHISKRPDLVGTDPSFYGTGHRGAEYDRVQREGGLDRSYFYSGPEGTVAPERAVMGMDNSGNLMRGPRYAYEGDLTGLYDLQQDPEGLVALSRAYNLPSYQPALPHYMSKALEGRSPIPDLERLVREYGYKGYITDRGPGQRWAAMYDPVEELRRIERGADGYAEGGLVR